MKIVNAGGLSPASGLQQAQRANAKALWPYISTRMNQGKGFFWKVRQQTAPGITPVLKGGLQTDLMSEFLTRDESGLWKFRARDNNAVKRSALLVKKLQNADDDSIIFERNMLQMGMSADGYLTHGKGSMFPDPLTDYDVFEAGSAGWTFVCDLCIPANGFNAKVTYSDDSVKTWTINNGEHPWALLGSRAIRDATGRAFSIYVDGQAGASQGRLFIRHRGATALWSQTDWSLDLRVGPTRHRLIMGWDQASGEINVWSQSNSETTPIATKTGVVQDLDVAPADGKKMRLWGVGTEGDGASLNINGGFFSILGFAHDPTLHTSDTKRAALWDWMDSEL